MADEVGKRVVFPVVPGGPWTRKFCDVPIVRNLGMFVIRLFVKRCLVVVHAHGEGWFQVRNVADRFRNRIAPQAIPFAADGLEQIIRVRLAKP